MLGGAVVAFLIAFWLQGGWFQGGGQVEALSAKVSQIEGTLADATSSGPIDTLATRIDALETAAKERASAETASASDLVARVEALEAQTQAQGAGGQTADAGASTPDLTSRLAQLDDRLAALESADAQAASSGQATGAQLQSATAKLEDVESRLSQLAGSIDQLSQRLGADEQQSQALAGQISALGERLTGAESKLQAAAQNRDQAAALALILGQLEAAIEEARPYQTQVQALTAMAGDDAAIKQAVSALEPGAASGVPSLATLRQSFAPVANEIVHAARAPEGNNLIDRATDNLMRLVTVRPVGGDVRGDSVEARVARAEASLNEGDLAAAVAELEPLEGRPAEAAAGWLKQAKARLGAEQAIGQLRAHATDLLTQAH